MATRLVAVAEADKSVLANLIQLYQYDSSIVRDLVLSAHGTYTYRYLDGYFTEPDREPYLTTVDGSFDHNNKPAEALWRPVAGSLATGPVTEIDRFPPDVDVASTRVAFPRRVKKSSPALDHHYP